METLRRVGHWIDGESVGVPPGDSFEILRPSDDTPCAVAVRGTVDDVAGAVDAAERAFRHGPPMTPSARESSLFRAADELQRSSGDFERWLVEETGSPIAKARREVATSVGVLRAAAGAARRVSGETLSTDVPGRWSLSRREPLGVIAGITPFNVPLIKSIKHSAMALATGNTVVLLPSPEAPTVAVETAKLYERAGFPSGRCNVVVGDGAVIGDALTSDPRVRAIGFTGSTRTGRHIAGIAGRLGKRVTLEMGGKNPLVILADADLEQALPAVVAGGFLFQGQICMSSSRVYVERPLFDAVAERLAAAAGRLPAGDLWDERTVIGPLINARQRERVRRHLDDALTRGARLLCGGRWEGQVCLPTVLTGIDDAMLISREETFGPLVTLEPVDGLGDAIARCNATPFGLTAAIFTGRLSAAMRFADEVRAGMVHVNGMTIQEEAHVPFGGVGDSGFGREGALVGIDAMTEWKWITLQGEPSDPPDRHAKP